MRCVPKQALIIEMIVAEGEMREDSQEKVRKICNQVI